MSDPFPVTKHQKDARERLRITLYRHGIVPNHEDLHAIWRFVDSESESCYRLGFDEGYRIGYERNSHRAKFRRSWLRLRMFVSPRLKRYVENGGRHAPKETA